MEYKTTRNLLEIGLPMVDTCLICRMNDNNDTENIPQSFLLNCGNDDMVDFKRSSLPDTIHCEYETPSTPVDDTAALQPNASEESNGWKLHRPSFARSICKCMTCSFSSTALAGVFVGITTTAVIWLIINLAGSCFRNKAQWYDAPIYIQRIRITVEAFEGSVIQLWSFVNFLAVFHWPLVKRLNLLNWNMLVSFVNGLYVLLLNVYRLYTETWTSYPLCGLFIIMALFNGYRIASFYRTSVKERLLLAIRLGGQFYFGFPIVMVCRYLLIPFSLTLPESKQAIILSFIPSFTLMPKILGRTLVQKLQGVNHPGTSWILLIVLYIYGATVARVLQAGIHNFRLFIMSCFIHGLIGAIDKLTLPFQNYIYKNCLKCCKCLVRRRVKAPRENRLLADLALLSIVVETSSVFVNCAVVQILRFYFGRDIKGMKYDGYVLFTEFLWRVTIAVFIEWIFNTLTIKLQTYFYNIPVIRVWNSKWRWIMMLVILNTVIALLFFTEHLLAVVKNKSQLVDPKVRLKCLEPFQRL